MLPVAEALRHGGVPYGYLSDAKLKLHTTLAEHRVLVLPEIACLSTDEREGVRRFIRGGGNAVILGELGSADEVGTAVTESLLEELFGFTMGAPGAEPRQFEWRPPRSFTGVLQYPDEEPARRYFAGTMRPLFALTYGRDATVPTGANVLAEFKDTAGQCVGKPAIVSFENYGGRVVCLAGFPTRITPNRAFGTVVNNLAHQLVARLVEWVAGAPPSLRVEGWPPMVPMRRLRPLDQRFMPTFEFFPLVGETECLGVITSYYREPAMFPMVLTVPEGKHLVRVRELISGAEVPHAMRDGEARIMVELTFDTPAFVFRFELKGSLP